MENNNTTPAGNDPQMSKDPFELTQDGETIRIYGQTEGSAMTDYENSKEPLETETFFDWCKNSYEFEIVKPAGNDPQNWFFRAYDDRDNMMEQRVIKDRTEDEARRECESYVEQPGNKWIEDWTLTPATAGNDLPQQLKAGEPMQTKIGKHQQGLSISIYNDDFENENGYYIGQLTFLPEQLNTRRGIAQEIVRRYNDFPALLEAIIELDKQCCFVHRHWGEGGNREAADAAEKRIKELILKHSKQ